jgi:hypothetical protein
VRRRPHHCPPCCYEGPPPQDLAGCRCRTWLGAIARAFTEGAAARSLPWIWKRGDEEKMTGSTL